MICDWTEKVSCLVDGELSRAEAASVEAHLDGCGECRAAHGEFLSFRRRLSSYRAAVDPAAQRRALETILASKRGPARRATPESAGAASWREKVRAALGVSPWKPAAAAVLMLVLAAFGLTLYLNVREGAHNVAQSPAAETGGAPPPIRAAAGPATPPDDKVAGQVLQVSPGGGRASADAKAGPQRREGRRARRLGGDGSRVVAASVRPPDDPPRPAPPAGPHDDTASASGLTGRRGLPRAGLNTARHLEQAQMLLRSFRNARATDDLAYERERSQRLLFRNIVLRREAASKGDPVVASVLGRLEPILIDIANLPESPTPDDVDPIRERMRKKNLVVVLQAGGLKTSRQ